MKLQVAQLSVIAVFSHREDPGHVGQMTVSCKFWMKCESCRLGLTVRMCGACFDW